MTETEVEEFFGQMVKDRCTKAEILTMCKRLMLAQAGLAATNRKLVKKQREQILLQNELIGLLSGLVAAAATI